MDKFDQNIKAIQQAFAAMFGQDRIRVIVARDEAFQFYIRGRELSVFSDMQLTRRAGSLKSPNGKLELSTVGTAFWNQKGTMVQAIRYRRQVMFVGHEMLVQADWLTEGTLTTDCGLYKDTGRTVKIVELKHKQRVLVQVSRDESDSVEVIVDGQHGFVRAKNVA